MRDVCVCGVVGLLVVMLTAGCSQKAEKECTDEDGCEVADIGATADAQGGDVGVDADAGADVGDSGDGGDIGPVEIPEGARLEHIDPCNSAAEICARNLTFDSNTELGVRLAGPDSQPIRGAMVRFELDQGQAQGTMLAAAEVATGPQGIASTTLRSGTTAGTVEVTASVEDADVEPLRFVVAVNSTITGNYVISFTYGGGQEIDEIDALLYASEHTCDAVHADLDLDRDGDPNTTPQLSTRSVGLGAVGAGGTLPQIVVPNIPEGASCTVYARARDADTDEELAYGCRDGNPPINDGGSVSIDVTLTDL